MTANKRTILYKGEKWLIELRGRMPKRLDHIVFSCLSNPKERHWWSQIRTGALHERTDYELGQSLRGAKIQGREQRKPK